MMVEGTYKIVSSLERIANALDTLAALLKEARDEDRAHFGDALHRDPPPEPYEEPPGRDARAAAPSATSYTAAPIGAPPCKDGANYHVFTLGAGRCSMCGWDRYAPSGEVLP